MVNERFKGIYVATDFCSADACFERRKGYTDFSPPRFRYDFLLFLLSPRPSERAAPRRTSTGTTPNIVPREDRMKPLCGSSAACSSPWIECYYRFINMHFSRGTMLRTSSLFLSLSLRLSFRSFLSFVLLLLLDAELRRWQRDGRTARHGVAA